MHNYDYVLGLYTVEKCWACTGLSGFQVYKYVLKRIQDQPPPPWKEVDVDGNKVIMSRHVKLFLIAFYLYLNSVLFFFEKNYK